MKECGSAWDQGTVLGIYFVHQEVEHVLHFFQGILLSDVHSKKELGHVTQHSGLV